MLEWIMTAVLAMLIGAIVRTEMRCGRKNKEFLAHINEDINALHKQATTSYRARFGRDPTAPFVRLDDDNGVSS